MFSTSASLCITRQFFSSGVTRMESWNTYYNRFITFPYSSLISQSSFHVRFVLGPSRMTCLSDVNCVLSGNFRTRVYWRRQIFARMKMYLLLILMFMYCFLLEVNQKLSDFRFPILNAKSIFRTFVRLLWDNRLAHIETVVCIMKYLAFLFLWFCVVNIELVLCFFFLKSTLHSR